MDSIKQNKTRCPFCRTLLTKLINFGGVKTHFICQVENCSNYSVVGGENYSFSTGNEENRIPLCRSSYPLFFNMNTKLNQTFIWDGAATKAKRLYQHVVLNKSFNLYLPEERDELLKIGKRIITNLGLL